MAGIIPKNKIKGVDICGSQDWCYIIRSDLGCYMRSSNFHKGSDISIHDLHPSCRHGDHYIADPNYFYIIKGDSYRRVTDLSEDTDSSVETLRLSCRGGDHYLKAFVWFYIIFQEKGTYRKTVLSMMHPLILHELELSDDEFTLPPECRDGLYYWGDLGDFSFLKLNSDWGVQYYKCTDLDRDVCTEVYSVHPDVLNFLPGGLSITNGPAFSKWVNIKSVSNDRLTPMKWEKKVTKRVGYNKEMSSQITRNWKIAASSTITSGDLTGLITSAQFSYSAEYGGARVDAKTENWNEETEDEETLSFELQPNESLYVWQYQLGLGSESVLFCKDLKFTDQPNPPTDVPLPSV
ncbi:uncharacterized protein LOC120465246 [Pimephales promelas]|uniref:uncharacterized protein LOC120465246 n=1 Tax=Pimephales promelas TaxID=90988 RepID=UPI001955E790|nr:uncharacterized protein LOC120465246 [Pimephales promelas]XP_039510831.1 uncharacterized protein LOC120465246 [Pimephales promelas]